MREEDSAVIYWKQYCLEDNINTYQEVTLKPQKIYILLGIYYYNIDINILSFILYNLYLELICISYLYKYLNFSFFSLIYTAQRVWLFDRHALVPN